MHRILPLKNCSLLVHAIKTNFTIQEPHLIQVIGNFRNLAKKIYPVYYIDLENEQIVGILRLTNHEIRDRLYITPQYNPYLEYCFDNKDHKSKGVV